MTLIFQTKTFYNATQTSNSSSNERLWLFGLPLISPPGRKPDEIYAFLVLELSGTKYNIATHQFYIHKKCFSHDRLFHLFFCMVLQTKQP